MSLFLKSLKIVSKNKMKISNPLKLIISLTIPQLAGAIGSFFTISAITDPSTGSGQAWYAGLVKPALNPPNWVFGPAWTTLFLLMGVALYLVWSSYAKASEGQAKHKKQALIVFGIQLVLNTLWSIIFFGSTTLTINGLNNIGLAFLEIIVLWLAVLATIVYFHKVSRIAAWLLVPYILWVSFAGYLNI